MRGRPGASQGDSCFHQSEHYRNDCGGLRLPEQDGGLGVHGVWETSKSNLTTVSTDHPASRLERITHRPRLSSRGPGYADRGRLR
jgi:hypothetical protein